VEHIELLSVLSTVGFVVNDAFRGRHWMLPSPLHRRQIS